LTESRAIDTRRDRAIASHQAEHWATKQLGQCIRKKKQSITMEDLEAKVAALEGNVSEGDAMDTEDNSGRKTDLNNSSTSLDKYVGRDGIPST